MASNEYYYFIYKHLWERVNGDKKHLLGIVLVQTSQWKTKLMNIMFRRGVDGGISYHY